MFTFTFTWREEEGGDFFTVEIRASDKDAAHSKWLDYCDGYWDTDDLVYYECIEGTKDDVKLPTDGELRLGLGVDYQAGREAASADMLVEGFDIYTALRSFEEDPADTPFQEGYLRELEEAVSGHA